MQQAMDPKDFYKKQAAEQAVDSVRDGMIVGLGHGSTAIHAIRRIAARILTGELKDIRGVPCSLFVQGEAEKLGVPLTTLEHHPHVDLTIDGADEIDPDLNVIKGGGGALIREKIVASASKRVIIVVDESKCSPRLGTLFPVPIEVIPFALRPVRERIAALAKEVTVRQGADGKPFLSDQGNLILDGRFGPIPDLKGLAGELDAIAGLVGHGLFLGIATDVIIAGAAGVRHQQRAASHT
ncbi:MAG: ribose-5-phosphate isomerase A [Candidatus Hydrogenedentota bacterium]